MNQRSSNKYLFDQTVNCDNCKYKLRDTYYNDTCLLNPINEELFLYYNTIYIRNPSIRFPATLRQRHAKSTEREISNDCGPLGVYFEPKSE